MRTDALLCAIGRRKPFVGEAIVLSRFGQGRSASKIVSSPESASRVCALDRAVALIRPSEKRILYTMVSCALSKAGSL